MSHLLWEYYYNGDLDKFRRLLSESLHDVSQLHLKKGANLSGHGSICANVFNQKVSTKQRRVSGHKDVSNGVKGSDIVINRAEINSRDCNGLTLLHRAVSSTSRNMNGFALALLDHPAIDIYAQDTENGWTSLHRALYFGKATIAKVIIQKELLSAGETLGNILYKGPTSLMKIKDHEKNNAFDLYNTTIFKQAREELRISQTNYESDDDNDIDEDISQELSFDSSLNCKTQFSIDGDEILAWGSNRNHGLGFRDQDDRHHPEKIILKRPDNLLFRFYREYLSTLSEMEKYNFNTSVPKSVADLPSLITNRPIIIQDVILSKLHSAILTTDPESNLYMCGFGPGGRLGTGDQDTRFCYVPVHGGALAGLKVKKITLGQNHTLALVANGTIVSWGSNLHYQLGYSLPRSNSIDEEPVSTTPRMIYGPLKKECVEGIAASTIHSVAHTSTSLYTWGKNEGQLGLMDSESQTLKYQTEPRKIAASLFKSSITSVSAIDGATVVLLSNHTVFVFTNYCYKIVKFPSSEDLFPYHLKPSSFSRCYDTKYNYVTSITASGNTIGAITKKGDLFTFDVRTHSTNMTSNTTSLLKIKDCLSNPERLWSPQKGDWDSIKSASITENGCVLVCTQAGAVWRSIKRSKVQDFANRKKYKFERISGLANIVAVRSTIYGVHVAVKKTRNNTGPSIVVDEKSIWTDISPLLFLAHNKGSKSVQVGSVEEIPKTLIHGLQNLFKPDVSTSELEDAVSQLLLHRFSDESYNMEIGTSTSQVKIPIHSFVLGRSSVFRKALAEFRRYPNSNIRNEGFILKNEISEDKNSKTSLIFQGMSFITLLNLCIYLYTDILIDLWDFYQHTRPMTSRFHIVRGELIKFANYLKLDEIKIKMQMTSTSKEMLSTDLYIATLDPNFFDDGDTVLELKDSEILAHSAILCCRCPFFKGLFIGRSTGQWISSRRQETSKPIKVDLKHIQSDVFRLVLSHIYSDYGEKLFDNIVCTDIDEFSYLVLDVMAVADELMLDRLSQICQKILSNFVNERNICNLLNHIAPCSVSVFKSFALEFICLHLDSMIENHLLNDLGESLLQDLDKVIRRNQLNCLPFSRSGKADSNLLKKFPNLVEDIKEERTRRLRDSAFVAQLRDEFPLPHFKKSISSTIEINSQCSLNQDSPSANTRYLCKTPYNSITQHKLSSTGEKISDNNGNNTSLGECVETALSGLKSISTSAKCNEVITTISDSKLSEPTSVIARNDPNLVKIMPGNEPADIDRMKTVSVWPSMQTTSVKFDMRQIMEQAKLSYSTTSNDSHSRKSMDDAKSKLTPPKLSQKERKKKQQQKVTKEPRKFIDSSTDKESDPVLIPWHIPERGSNISLTDIVDESPSKTREVHNTRCSALFKSNYDKWTETHPTVQACGKSELETNSLVQENQTESEKMMPHDKRNVHFTNKSQSLPQLSLADIIRQQKREQEIIKEAVARRSLREIQEEQAFQEWWDKESKRIQMEEAAKNLNFIDHKNGERSKTINRGDYKKGRKI